MEMKTRLLPVSLCLAAVAALAAGCGGGGSKSVSPGAIAVVGSTQITKASFSQYMSLGLANYQAHGQKPPKVGTPLYAQLKGEAVTYLVDEEELRQEAQKVGITVTQKDVAARLAVIKRTYFHNSEKKLDAALKKDRITVSELEQYDLMPQLLGQKVYDKVTSSAKVSKADAKKYYDQNKASFTTPPTREVRHILVDTKSLAEKLEKQLKSDPASFARLAKKYSKDTTSAKHGGKLCVAHGGNSGLCQQTVTPFDRVAFSLKTHAISPPVHSVYGWHIIQALGPVKPSHTSSFSQVYTQIQQNLLQTKKSQAWSQWLVKLKKDFQGKVAYQTGYEPPATTTAGSSTLQITTG
jgi:foldase protein PrsA